MTMPQVLSEVLSPALVRGVGYALLHSLWQGVLLAVLLAGVLPLLRRHRAEVRYAVAASALAALVVVVGLTFGFYYQSPPVAAAPLAASSVAGRVGLLSEPALAASVVPVARAWPAAGMAWLRANASKVEAYLPLVVVGWLLGLLLMSGRLAGGLLYTRRLRRAGTQALGADWQQRLAALARRAGVRRPVALLESARVAGPLVLGHLRPVILLPLGAVAGLSPALLEALLAHELAHIVRRDYLLNLGLAVAEVLFFYHPAVWFMASCLRAERENCCDDQAAALCGGDRLRVARALAALAELEATARPVPHLALAAAGPGGRGSLLARVQRLALGRPQAPTLGESLLAVLLGALGLAGLSTGVALAAPAEKQVANELITSIKQVINPVDTARQPLSAGGPPAVADTRHEPASVAASGWLRTPKARAYAAWQSRPPRRGGASTVVIEKDKKGRIVSLSVDGQPVETATPGKKAKRSKPVRTVEVVQVPGQPARPERLERLERLERPEQPERPERPEHRTYSFNFSPNKANEMAQFGLVEALQNTDLTAEHRQEMERELDRLKAQGKKYEQDLKIQLDDLHIDLNGPAEAASKRQQEAQRRMQDGQRRLANGQRRLEQSQRQFEDAERRFKMLALNDNANLTDRNADRADLAARRAELRARMAADAAELRALERGNARQLTRVPALPRVPAVPSVPGVPQVPTPPLPPNPGQHEVRLREALRTDGLIKDEKHFSFELNDAGGRVDGTELTAAQAAKYRRLLNLPTTKIKGSSSTYKIKVDESSK